jgi:hypothetical protein
MQADTQRKRTHTAPVPPEQAMIDKEGYNVEEGFRNKIHWISKS